MTKILIYVVTAILALLIALSITRANVPDLISYQGYLEDAEGTPVDEAVTILFSIWTTPVGGEMIWSELHEKVLVSSGLFSVILGSQGTPVTTETFGSNESWLQIAVNGETAPGRTQLTSVGLAHRVSTVDGATAGQVTGDLSVTGNLSVNQDASLGRLQVSNLAEIGSDLRVYGEVRPDGGIVSPNGITIISTGSDVIIIAGTSQITISPTGGVTIQSEQVTINATDELNLTATNRLSIDAAVVAIRATDSVKVDSDGFVDMNSALNMNIKSAGLMNAHASAVMDIQGALVNIN